MTRARAWGSGIVAVGLLLGGCSTGDGTLRAVGTVDTELDVVSAPTVAAVTPDLDAGFTAGPPKAGAAQPAGQGTSGQVAGGQGAGGLGAVTNQAGQPLTVLWTAPAGSKVAKGDEVARLDAAELDAAVRMADADVTLADARLTLLEENLDEVDDGIATLDETIATLETALASARRAQTGLPRPGVRPPGARPPGTRPPGTRRPPTTPPDGQSPPTDQTPPPGEPPADPGAPEEPPGTSPRAPGSGPLGQAPPAGSAHTGSTLPDTGSTPPHTDAAPPAPAVPAALQAPAPGTLGRAIPGGTRNPAAQAGQLQRRIGRLQQQLATLRGRRSALREHREQARSRRTQLRAGRDAARTRAAARRQQRDLAVLTAPVDGYVTAALPAGSPAQPGAHLVTIRPAGPRTVTAWLPPADAATLCPKDEVRIGGDWGQSADGTVTTIAGSADFPPSSTVTEQVHLTRAVRITVTTPDDLPAGVPVELTLTPCHPQNRSEPR